MMLWALRRDDRLELWAAPSSEAALAACTEPGDRVARWPADSHWHAQDVRDFLVNFQPAGFQA